MGSKWPSRTVPTVQHEIQCHGSSGKGALLLLVWLRLLPLVRKAKKSDDQS